MAVIFSTDPGRVAVLQGDSTAGLPVAIDGLAGAWYPPFKAIVTAISVALDGNYQAMHTLDDVIYFYVFGDRISNIRIDGLAFQGDCNDPGGVSGVDAILNAYATNRIAARSRPVQIQIGTSVAGRFRGYLIGNRLEITRPDERVASFSFPFLIIPNNTGSPGGGNGPQDGGGGGGGGAVGTGGFFNPGVGP